MDPSWTGSGACSASTGSGGSVVRVVEAARCGGNLGLDLPRDLSSAPSRPRDCLQTEWETGEDRSRRSPWSRGRLLGEGIGNRREEGQESRTNRRAHGR
nr:unnamed protein product [Digitaria exilis]